MDQERNEIPELKHNDARRIYWARVVLTFVDFGVQMGEVIEHIYSTGVVFHVLAPNAK